MLPIYFGEMLMNSLFVALGTALFAVVLGASAAYSFSRFKFYGRQAGLLTFIILLMLPATGTLVVLYVMFNSVQVNTVLAYAVPSYFSGAVVALAVFIVYRVVAAYVKPNPERWFNPPPALVLAVVILLALIAFVLTFAIMFERSPVYAAVVDEPLAAAAEPLDEAQEEYRRRAATMPRAEGTARRAQTALDSALEVAGTMTRITGEAAGTSDLGAYLQTEIDSRTASVENPDRDFVIETLVSAQEALNTDGEAAALAVVNAGLETANTEVADAQDTIIRAQENVTSAQETLQEAEANLLVNREAFDEVQAQADRFRNAVLIGLIPYYLLALAGALILAGVLWGGVYLLRDVIEPRTAVTVLMVALLVAITLSLGTSALQQRLSGTVPPTVTLRLTLFGLALAFASGQLPFAIWNLKGYFDTIPKDLEEAALIDGAGRISTFFRIMIPLSLPAFAIVILFSFMGSWTEFILSWTFLTGSIEDYTLAMALVSMANGSNTAPPDMQKFAAMSILISVPILVLFFAAQRWIVSGLTLGAVK